MDVIETDVSLVIGIGGLIDSHTQGLVIELREGSASVDGHLQVLMRILPFPSGRMSSFPL